MSSLTEEQRKRIEENRRKALEKRAALAATSNPNKASILQPNKSQATHFQFITDSSPNNKSTIHTESSCSSTTAAKFYSSFNSNKSVNLKTNDCNKSTNGNSSNKVHVKTFQSQNVTIGTCILLTRQRFYVNITYNKELIDIFKSIPSKLYDAQARKWNFLISDHEKLIKLTKSLEPNVLIVPLHRFITKTFVTALPSRIMKEHDLSSLDAHLLRSLLPFQREGVDFGIERNGKVLIADDMGLGKTIQAIALANYYCDDWPLLVITPSSVRYTWEEAFHTWLPSLDRQEITVINSGKDHIPNNKVILMSYDMLKKMKDKILTRNFKSIILDESHFLKNYKSARTQAFQEVVKGMKRIIMLSGTPALSRPIELFTQISALLPRNFFSFSEYGMRYCNGKKTAWGMDYSGSSNMEELQICLEEIVMIRRLKSEVIKQLPMKFRQMIILDPSRVHTQNKILKAMSQKMKDKNLNNSERRGALLEYFHQTGESKLQAVCEYINDLLEADKKFICFGHHQSMINGICDAIQSRKVDYIRIDGSVSSEQRKKLCDKFQFHDDCKVAVLSITSANCGITLTSASLVIFAELFWNPGILTQAEDRAHRIGQENSVVVQYLVAKNTADDEIWPLVQHKLDILNKAGLSKDNFKSVDTIVKENSTQPCLEIFWNELNNSLSFTLEDTSPSPEKRIKLE